MGWQEPGQDVTSSYNQVCISSIFQSQHIEQSADRQIGPIVNTYTTVALEI